MKLYIQLILAGMRARLQYKFDFIASTFFYGLITVVEFLTVAAVLYRYNYVAGWNVYEVAVLAGVAGCSYGLYRTLASELDSFETYLVGGEFDTLLIRPWPTIASLLARNFDLGRLGAFIQGALVLTIGLRGVLGQGAPAWVGYYIPLLPLAGFCVLTAISLATSALGFWIIRVYSLQTFTLNAPNSASNYPLDIYPQWLRWLLTTVLPVAAVSYIPVNFALGKGGAPWHLLVPLLAAPLSLLVGLALWRLGERHYQSTGN